MRIRFTRDHDDTELWDAIYLSGSFVSVLGVWDEETIDSMFQDMGWRETIDNITNKGPESIDFIVDFKTGQFDFL